MQTIIDFLANNYLWFIIIALILIFALIGYLVDTSEKTNQSSLMENSNLENENSIKTIKESEMESLYRNMEAEEIQELEKDIIVMPSQINQDLTSKNTIESNSKDIEVLDDLA